MGRKGCESETEARKKHRVVEIELRENVFVEKHESRANNLKEDHENTPAEEKKER